MEIKLKKELKLGEETTFKFGISDSDKIECWNPGYKLLDDWSYIDSKEFDSSIIRFFRNMDSLRKIEWTVRYQLNSTD